MLNSALVKVGLRSFAGIDFRYGFEVGNRSKRIRSNLRRRTILAAQRLPFIDGWNVIAIALFVKAGKASLNTTAISFFFTTFHCAACELRHR